MEQRLIIAGTLWLSGFVAGVLVVARWRRMGDGELVVARPEPVVDESPSATPGKVQRTAQRLAGPVVAGAKADILTVRNATRSASNRIASTVGVRSTG